MDEMMDLTAGDALVWRRLEAYAGTRLSPDLATSSRLRARVMAVAHRQAALARADTALTVLPQPEPTLEGTPFSPRAQQLARATQRRRGRPWTRVAAVVLAASLSVSVAVGGAFAARPGALMYDARIWAETLTLPTDPSARAVAELARLKERLREVAEASRSGDATGAMAALEAYERIVDEASTSAILADDEVAAAILVTGVGRNVEVLQSLMARVPDRASVVISRAVDAAIARSTDALDRINASQPGGPGKDNGNGGPATDSTSRPTKAPATKSTAEPTIRATPKPKPTPKPTPEATSAPTPRPEKTPKPHGGPPGGPPGQNGRETQGKSGG
jgi:hypothetical protein